MVARNSTPIESISVIEDINTLQSFSWLQFAIKISLNVAHNKQSERDALTINIFDSKLLA